MKTVIACIDNSSAARPVVKAARAIAPLFAANAEAVHVVENGDATARAAAAEEALPFHVVRGDVASALAELSHRDDVVAVVVGARDRPAGTRPAGHVALEVAGHADALVLVVPPDASIGSGVDRVLVAMKGTPSNTRTLKRAIDLVGGVGVELVVVHVDDESTIPSFADQVQHDTEAYVQDFLTRYAPGAGDAQLELRVGVPADEIVRAAAEIHPDIVAIGCRQGRPEESEVVHDVLERCTVPVLLVPLA